MGDPKPDIGRNRQDTAGDPSERPYSPQPWTAANSAMVPQLSRPAAPFAAAVTPPSGMALPAPFRFDGLARHRPTTPTDDEALLLADDGGLPAQHLEPVDGKAQVAGCHVPGRHLGAAGRGLRIDHSVRFSAATSCQSSPQPVWRPPCREARSQTWTSSMSPRYCRLLVSHTEGGLPITRSSPFTRP